MAKKELRTVKKSSQTGRLNRAEVRSAVITVRDKPTGQFKSSVRSRAVRNAASGTSEGQHPRGKSKAS